MPDLLNVSIGDKYTVVQSEKGSVRALRNGEEWRDLTGDGLILAMAYRIEELENALENAVKS